VALAPSRRKQVGIGSREKIWLGNLTKKAVILTKITIKILNKSTLYLLINYNNKFIYE